MMGSVALRAEPANDPFTPSSPDGAVAIADAARVVVPAAHGEDDEEVCGVCFEAPPPGQLAKLLCCRNMLCLKDAQRVGTCPFCREEPMAWGLQ